MDNGIPTIFDGVLYRARRDRAARTGGEIPLADEAAAGLGERLGAVNRQFVRALDIGSRQSGFAPVERFAGDWTHVAASDGDLTLPPASFDLAVSVLSLQAVNDLPGVLAQIRRALKPDGLFMGALFAGETLNELRQAFALAESETRGGASPRVAPFADVRSLGGLLSRVGFALPVADLERTTIRYSELPRLFGDLRALGETNVLTGRSRHAVSRRIIAALEDAYRTGFSENGKYVATFDIAYLVGWAPHESQQKPLKPGSAKARLADALGVPERETGDTIKPPR